VSTGFEFVPSPLSYNNEYIDAVSAQQTLRNYYYEIGLSYDRTFKSHHVGVLAQMSRENFVTGSNWPNKREDWVGRITYDYEGKYLFELMVLIMVLLNSDLNTGSIFSIVCNRFGGSQKKNL